MLFMKNLVKVLFCTLLVSCANKEVSQINKDVNDNIINVQESNLQVNESNNSPSEIELNYDFKNGFPHTFVCYGKFYFLGDGEKIYHFNSEGEFIKKIKVPDAAKYFTSIAVTWNDNSFIFHCASNGSIISFNEFGNILQKNDGGEIIKTDKNGNILTIIQNYDSTIDDVINYIKVLKNDGENITINNGVNYATLNFEVIESIIMTHISEQKFITISNAFERDNYIYKEYSLNEFNEERIWFLGKMGDNLFFKTFNFSSKKDVIHIYDTDLHKIKEYVLDYNYDEIVDIQKKDDIYMDFPSGIFYTYYENKIYFLRNTLNGSRIYTMNFR
jgi:hypothetical protein